MKEEKKYVPTIKLKEKLSQFENLSPQQHEQLRNWLNIYPITNYVMKNDNYRIDISTYRIPHLTWDWKFVRNTDYLQSNITIREHLLVTGLTEQCHIQLQEPS